MNVCTRRLCLPPLFETNAEVVEGNAIGIQTFAVGPVDRNKLRREVQHLPKFLLTFPKRLDQLLLLSDIHSGAHESPASPFLSRESTHATDASNLSVRPHNSLREVECSMGRQDP